VVGSLLSKPKRCTYDYTTMVVAGAGRTKGWIAPFPRSPRRGTKSHDEVVAGVRTAPEAF